MTNRILPLLAAGLMGLSAQAQDANWSGFHTGLTLGHSQYTTAWRDEGYDWYGGTLKGTKKAFLPAIHVGYDWQFGATVVGVELDHSFASANMVTHYNTTVVNPVPDVVRTDKAKGLTTLRGRFGVAKGNTLFFLTAGFGKVKADHTWIENGDVPDSWPTFSNTKAGFVSGLGLEHRLNTRFSVRVELQNFRSQETVSVNPNQYGMHVSDSFNTVRVGGSFHF